MNYIDKTGIYNTTVYAEVVSSWLTTDRKLYLLLSNYYFDCDLQQLIYYVGISGSITRFDRRRKSSSHARLLQFIIQYTILVRNIQWLRYEATYLRLLSSIISVRRWVLHTLYIRVGTILYYSLKSSYRRTQTFQSCCSESLYRLYFLWPNKRL